MKASSEGHMKKKESSTDQGCEVWDQGSAYNRCMMMKPPRKSVFKYHLMLRDCSRNARTGCLFQQTPRVPSTAATYSLPKKGRIACEPGDSASLLFGRQCP